MTSPFTALQWKELEHQALIFKYFMAGMPVPTDLLLPIRRSFESVSARLFQHPSLGYCSFYGKKMDPEPGRCRRTDGKKWRCSKNAHPDSKYCERHMQRGRSRSRKLVESQTTSQSLSTVTSLAGAKSSKSFENLSLQTISNPRDPCSGTNSSLLHWEPMPQVIGNREYRYPHGLKPTYEDSFFSGASGSAKGLGMESSLDSTGRLMPSQVSSFPTSKSRTCSILQSDYQQIHTLEDLGSAPINAALSKRQHCLFGSEFISPEHVKHESQYLRPFFDEWPRTRYAWSDLEDERLNRTSFSTTQLSISTPMASSDFSATSSRSPKDD